MIALEGNLTHAIFQLLQYCYWQYVLVCARSKFSVCYISLTLQCCYVLLFVLEGNLARVIFLSSCNVLVFVLERNLPCARFPYRVILLLSTWFCLC